MLERGLQLRAMTQLRLLLPSCAHSCHGGVASRGHSCGLRAALAEGELRQQAEVAEDDSLAEQRRGVGCLHHLLGLGLLTLHLQQQQPD